MTVAPPTDHEVADEQRIEAPGTDHLPLPRVGKGERRTRREVRQRQRRRTLTMCSAVLVAVTVVAAVLAYGWSTLRDLDRNAGSVDADDGLVASGGPRSRTLLIHEGRSGDLVSLTVLAAGEAGGDVVFLPPGSMVEVPSFGLDALRDAYQLGGASLLEGSVENLFGAAFDEVAVIDDDDLGALVAAAGSLIVDVPAPVERVSGSGRVEVLFPEGPVEVSPAEVDRLLAEPGQGTDLDRMVRHQRFWQSWLAAAAAYGFEADGALARTVRALAEGAVDYHVLPVEALGTSDESEGELYRVRFDRMADLVARVAPDAPSGQGVERIEVQVLNGTGAPGVSRRVQPALVPAGASVVLAGNADNFDYATTQIVYYAEEDLAAAQAVREALGLGEVVRSLSGLDVVDVTVVVGTDFDEGGNSR